MMEVPQNQELDELLEELEGESEEEEALSPQVEELLRDLQPSSPFMTRLRAARLLGGISMSSRRVVQTLATVAETDSVSEVRAMAAESLRAPVHREYMLRHPEVVALMERSVAQAPGKGETGRGMTGQSSFPIQCLKWSAIAGLAVGGAIGLWYAEVALSPGGSPACGAGFLVALIAGAVVGALVGGVVQGREDRITA
jgi:hypothetical protein